jgi:hypothetical protein
MHAKTCYIGFRTFPFIHALFSISQSSQYVSNDVKPHYKGFELVIQYVGKERALQIAGEYDRTIFFPLLVCVDKFLNPINVSEKIPNFAIGYHL